MENHLNFLKCFRLLLSNKTGIIRCSTYTTFILSASLVFAETSLLICLFIYEKEFRNEGLILPFSKVMIILIQLALASMHLILFMPIAALVFSLCFSQISLLLKNETTIESLEYKEDREMGLPIKNPFDKGWRSNLMEIMGPNPLGWIIPQTKKSIVPELDLVDFEI
jgi:hypothetical protein